METASVIKFCGNRFISLGEKGKLATSRDGVTWTEAKSGTNQVLVDAAFGHGWFVVIGRMGAVLRSRDGAAWEVQEHVAPPGTLTSMTFGGGAFVATGVAAWSGEHPFAEYPARAGFALLSVDGQQWVSLAERARKVFMPGARTVFPWLFDITYAKGMFVAVGWGGSILTSADGLWWEDRSAGIPDCLKNMAWGDRVRTEDLGSVAFGNGVFVVCGQEGSVLRSADTVRWTLVQTGGDLGATRVFFLNGQFVAASNKAPGVFFSSADGANWTRKSTGLSKLLVSMAYGNGRLLATAQDGSLCTVEVGPLPPDELRRPRPDIDPWSAASLVLRTLLREDVTTEIRALILAEVQPDALIQTEHIDIMAAAQRINRRRGEINFASLDAELAEHAFGCFSRDIMRNVYEDRQSGPIQLEEVKDLIWILRRPFG